MIMKKLNEPHRPSVHLKPEVKELLDQILQIAMLVNDQTEKEVIIEYRKNNIMIEGGSKRDINNFSYFIKPLNKQADISLSAALRDIEGML